jgi:hypothetical protein
MTEKMRLGRKKLALERASQVTQLSFMGKLHFRMHHGILLTGVPGQASGGLNLSP